MTARQDLLQAARSLAAVGQVEFSPVELIQEARRQGSTYPDTTLRTFINGPMCANSPDHHSVKWGDLVRVRRGRYRLAEPAPPDPPAEPDSAPAVGDHTGAEVDPQDEWHWEGNVQAAVVAHLAAEHWEIRQVADTAARQQGHDIEAVRDGQRLLVEVKGFPSTRYVRGPKRGQTKPTSPTLQARHWFATAILTGMLARGDDPDARVALAFPDFETYRTLARRTALSLADASIEILLVDVNGRVTTATPDRDDR